MAVGFRDSAGVDFDLRFDPYVQGTPPPATGYRTAAGVDLAGRYAPIEFGTKGPDVGYRTAAGLDVSNLWAAFGTAVYTIAGLNGKNLHASDQATTGQPIVNATVQFSIENDGTWSVFGGTSQGPVAQSAPVSGTWLPAGAAVSDYEVLIQVVSSGGAARVIGNNAAVYSPCTTTRTGSLTLPDASGNTANLREAEATFTISLRKIATGSVSTTVVNAHVDTLGYL